MRSSSSLAAVLLFACASTVSCADVVGVDKFHKRAVVAESAATGASEFLSLKLDLLNMKPHLGQMIEYRVIDGNNYIQSRGVVRALAGPDAILQATRAIPRANGPYRLDMYADVNGSGGFDGIGSVISNDHAWRIDPLVEKADTRKADDVVEVAFQHSTSFSNIDQYPNGTPNAASDTGLAAKVHLAGLDPFIGRLFEVRVAEHQSRHVVALYRGRVDTNAADAVVPGCVDIDTEYDVEIYVDANGDNQYNDPTEPGGDRGWRIAATSAVKGLDLSVDLASPANGEGDVDVGAP